MARRGQSDNWGMATMAATTAQKHRKKQSEWLGIGAGNSYYHRVHRPLQCLIFISPLLLLYQIGSTIQPWDSRGQAPENVLAFVKMLRFFHWFGANGSWLPMFAVVAILLAWHVARRDPWEFQPKLYALMGLEGLAWSIPMITMGLVLARNAGLSAPTLSNFPWQTQVVLSIGAGVYEEFVFRLVAITVLNLILIDIFELKPQAALPVIILTSAVMFSLYHYGGNEPFAWNTFFFRTAAGIFFAGVFIFRGFGITVAAHAFYDLIVVALTLKR